MPAEPVKIDVDLPVGDDGRARWPRNAGRLADLIAAAHAWRDAPALEVSIDPDGPTATVRLTPPAGANVDPALVRQSVTGYTPPPDPAADARAARRQKVLATVTKANPSPVELRDALAELARHVGLLD